MTTLKSEVPRTFVGSPNQHLRVYSDGKTLLMGERAFNFCLQHIAPMIQLIARFSVPQI